MNFKIIIRCIIKSSHDGFSTLIFENKKSLLRLKENLLIMRDQPSLNRTTTSGPLYPFHRLSS